jgi:hypothetical protein
LQPLAKLDADDSSSWSGLVHQISMATTPQKTKYWETVGTTNAPVGGVFSFEDAAPPVAGAFYRLRR